MQLPTTVHILTKALCPATLAGVKPGCSLLAARRHCRGMYCCTQLHPSIASGRSGVACKPLPQHKLRQDGTLPEATQGPYVYCYGDMRRWVSVLAGPMLMSWPLLLPCWRCTGSRRSHLSTTICMQVSDVPSGRGGQACCVLCTHHVFTNYMALQWSAYGGQTYGHAVCSQAQQVSTAASSRVPACSITWIAISHI